MNETKTKISLLWYGFCFLWFLALLPAMRVNSPEAHVKLASAEPRVLGAYTTNVRGDSALVATSTISTPQVNTDADTTAIKAKSFLVYDQDTDTDLFSKNSETRLPIASITKLLTALVVYDKLDLNAYYIVPENVGVREDPSLGIQAGEEVKGLDLFNAMLIGSENDAAQIFRLLVEQKTGKSFIEFMNEKAASLGMDGSEFSNALGFDSIHNYSTAEDVKKLINQTQQKSAFLMVGKQSSYSFLTKSGEEFLVRATNKLIKNHVDIYAIKTGNTKEALGCMATKAVINGHSVIIIVLGSWDREGDTLKLKELVQKSVVWN